MTNYNILTCDDEQIVIDSLQFIIKKNFEGQVNLFSALSGAEALQVVSTGKIDIIFMDINMPGMNGLETISCILNLHPETVIIMLSAFDKFQYAQEAMNLGAYKYITKPVNRNVVIQTVRNAMNLVDEKRGKGSEGSELQKKLDIISPMVESDFIYSCMFNTDKNDDLSDYLSYFNLSVTNYFFMCLEFPHADSKNQLELSTSIRKILSDKYKFIMGSFMTKRIALFISVDFEENDDRIEVFHEKARNIYTLLCLNIEKGIRAGISKISDTLENVTISYNESLSALNCTSPNGELLFSDETARDTAGDKKMHELSERIFNRLKSGDSAGVKFLSVLYCREQMERNGNMDEFKNNVFELIIEAKNITKQCAAQFDDSAFRGLFGFLSGASTENEIQDFLSARLTECTSAISSCREKKENPIIKKVCSYLNEHFNENFSLDDASSLAGVSPFYLSKLFKEETGETFVNYVTDKRLNKAKQLLSETDFSIKEITAQTGYNDQNYFSRLFKNKFGVTPTDFREMH